MSYTVEREFEHEGLKCVVTFCDMGHRCGYVGIPKEHELYGKKYGDYLDIKKTEVTGDFNGSTVALFLAVMDEEERATLGFYFDCHGGITYSDGGESTKYPIQSDLWWFGFDCAHYLDGKDLKRAYELFPKEREQILCSMQMEETYPTDGVVRTEEYVSEQCKHLAEQLKEYDERAKEWKSLY